MTTRNWKKPNSFTDCLKAGYEEFKASHGDEDGGAADALADVFHHSRDWTYAVIKGRTQFRAIDMPVWIRETGSYSTLEWICEQVGVIPVRVPVCSALGCTANTVREFAVYLDSVADAHADGKMTRMEASMIRHRGEAAIAAIHAEIAHCEKSVAGPRSLAEATG